MRFVSTRQQCDDVDLVTALSSGLAPDGGLFIPEEFPQIPLSAFDDALSPVQVGEARSSPAVRLLMSCRTF
jgi:threonine synthase